MPDNADQFARDQVVDLRRHVDREIHNVRESKVRKDVYAAEQMGTLARIAEAEKDIIALEAKVDKAEERRASDRRLILTSLVLPIVIGLIMLYIQTQIGPAQ